jgi:translocation and assembly module TamB
MNVAVDGTLAAPTLDGRARIDDGAVTVVPLRQRFEDVRLRVALGREHIRLHELSARAGRGTLRTAADVSLPPAGGLHATIDVHGDDLPLRRPGLPRMDLTTDVHTEIAVDEKRTDVDVTIRETLVDVSLGHVAAPKAIPTSDRVVYVSSRATPPPAAAHAEDTPTPPPASPTRIRIRLAEPLRIVGPAVDMAWEGEVLSVVGPDDVEAKGAFTNERGSFDLLGHPFEVESGTVTLPEGGDLVPYLDVVAHTQIEDVEITATVRGRADAPEIAFSSQPAFSQSEIFTMLVSGSADTHAADPDEVEAQAASMLAAFSNPALQRQLNERLRVDRIGVTFGDATDQPILSVGKNVTRDVYAESEYHFNAPRHDNRAQLNVRYRIAPRWSLETFFGDAAAGGVDLLWGRAFDIRHRRRSTRPPPKRTP